MSNENYTTLALYKDIITEIEQEGKENCSLLVGNGFNNAIGIKTSYKDIFTQMQKTAFAYNDSNVIERMKECNYDIEAYLEKFVKNNSEIDCATRKFLLLRIKQDFMKASQSLVGKGIRGIFQDSETEHRKQICLLLNSFSKYFSLNFDASMYTLLLHFQDNTALAFGPSKDDVEFSKLCDAIKDFIYNSGGMIISRVTGSKDIKEVLKDLFNDARKDKDSANSIYKFVNQNIDKITDLHGNAITKDRSKINKAIKHLINSTEEEIEPKVSGPSNDGFVTGKYKGGDQKPLSINVDNETQILDYYNPNLIFLHGSFHIRKDDPGVYTKITSESHQSLYNRINEVLKTESSESILCVLGGTSSSKVDQINEESILKDYRDVLESSKGSMLIIGCSFDDNDKHILHSIAKSQLKTLYVSTSKEDYQQLYRKIKNICTKQNIVMFDWMSATYGDLKSQY